MYKCFHRVDPRTLIVGKRFYSASMSINDCFGTLGIPVGSNEETIKNAYRKLAKTHHPDLGGSADRFVRIQRAYEALMDPAKRATASSRRSSTDSSSTGPGSSYWQSWGTGSTWWKNQSYSSEKDFDEEFEEQWKRYTERVKNRKSGRFKARAGSSSTTDSDAGENTRTRSEHYRSEREEDSHTHRKGRKSGKKYAKATDHPPGLTLSVLDKASSKIAGEYIRASNFNGRVCYQNSDKALFVFWSNRNKDWKISSVLKDDGDCVAFNSKIHPSIDSPFTPGNFSRWMVWHDRSRRYLPVRIQADLTLEDFSSWSVEQLRETLTSMGLRDKLDECFEKSQLVDLIKSFGARNNSHRSRSANDPIPENHYRLCSRQRHDGVVQAAPVLSDTCRTGNNRVDSFVGPVDEIESWLLRHGDRRRYYGVFDSERNFCFGLIWKNNKQWARAGPHDW
jgi:curved DNA-binding protein CbpA